MRVKPFHSCSDAFSFLELLLIIGILAVFALFALPKMSVGKKPCIYELRAKLAVANTEFLKIYERSITQGSEIAYQGVIDRLSVPISSSCYFVYSKKLVAYIEGEKLEFELLPKDFSSKPKIYCSLSSALCREFWGKTMKK